MSTAASSDASVQTTLEQGTGDLDVLLKAYELERIDDIEAASTMLVLLTATLGLLTLIGFALVNADSLPGWVVALVPLPPLPFIAFGALYAHLAQVRGALIDRYELELRRRFPALRINGLPIPSGHTVLGGIWVSWYGRSVLALSALPLLAMYVVVLIASFRHARQTDLTIALFSLTFSGIATALVIGLYVVALRPERALKAAESRLGA